MNTILRVLKPAFIVGSITFAIGFFGPIMWAPDANQGPLLGIFYTGPMGFMVGLVWGIVREIRRGSGEKSGTSKR